MTLALALDPREIEHNKYPETRDTSEDRALSRAGYAAACARCNPPRDGFNIAILWVSATFAIWISIVWILHWILP